MTILLLAISGYFINGYWWLFLVILGYITIFGDYFIIKYYWIF
jgi:hypothetical protein